jgi:hypothetical protein
LFTFIFPYFTKIDFTYVQLYTTIPTIHFITNTNTINQRVLCFNSLRP